MDVSFRKKKPKKSPPVEVSPLLYVPYFIHIPYHGIFKAFIVLPTKACPKKKMLSYMKLCAVQRTIFDTHVYLSYIKDDVCT